MMKSCLEFSFSSRFDLTTKQFNILSGHHASTIAIQLVLYMGGSALLHAFAACHWPGLGPELRQLFFHLVRALCSDTVCQTNQKMLTPRSAPALSALSPTDPTGWCSWFPAFHRASSCSAYCINHFDRKSTPSCIRQ